MTRSMLVGDTDYSHQSLENIETDLKEWAKNLSSTIQILEKCETQLKKHNYWKVISFNIQGYFGYSLEFFKTSLLEIESILCELEVEVCSHHIKRIRRLGKTAIEISRNLGKYWHEDPWEFEKDFGNPDFENVEEYYKEACSMADDMIDLGNLASRLDDFVGLKRMTKTKQYEERINSQMQNKEIKAFISYSHDNECHKKWVKELATCLRGDGIDVILDQWELVPGDQIPSFMEKAVSESDYVLIICTKKYKERSDKRLGGVGYEGDIMTAEVLNKQNQRKFIPILREYSLKESFPIWLSGKYYIDLSSSPYSQEQYDDLVSTLLGTKEKAPPLGSSNLKDTIKNANPQSGNISTSSEFIPIKIIGVIADQVGIPRNDGTRGSALYKIPFRLSQKPPREWEKLFIENWNHPPSFSTMHRPGIASIISDTVILDGTTIEEVKEYHRDTLKLVIQETNERYADYLEKSKRIKEREEERRIKHIQNVEDIANQINFDDN